MSIKVISVALVAIALRQAYAQTLQAGEVCSQTSECLPNVGLTCRKYLTPCTKGLCGCPDNQQFVTTKCETPPATVTALWLGDACTAENANLIRIENAVCDTGSTKTVVCASTAGVTKTDNLICKTATQKTIGDGCASTDTCIGYGDKVYQSASGGVVTCNGELKCACISTYIQVSGQKYCRPRTLGDACTSGQCVQANQECSTAGNCVCQTNYDAYQGECIIKGSVSQGTVCTQSSGTVADFLQKVTTCSPDLECTRCPEDAASTVKKCLKRYSGSSHIYPAAFHLVAAIFVGIFSKRMM